MKVIGIIVIVFVGFLWVNDYTPNEGVNELITLIEIKE
jgi:hypothetical protein